MKFKGVYLNFTFSTLDVTRWPVSHDCRPPPMLRLTPLPVPTCLSGPHLMSRSPLIACLTPCLMPCLMLCLMLCLAGCGGGGGGGLSAAGPVVLVDGSDRIDGDSSAVRSTPDARGPDEAGLPTRARFRTRPFMKQPNIITAAAGHRLPPPGSAPPMRAAGPGSAAL